MGRRRGQPPGVYTNGPLLRDARRALGLSREALCARDSVDVSVRTVQTAESGGPVSMESARCLAEVLGVSYASAVRPSPDALRRRLREAGRGPERAPSPWVGRSTESAAMVAALSKKVGRAVCAITGPPGAGKTALAQHVAELLGERFPDGVVWVDAHRHAVVGGTQAIQREIAVALGFEACLAGIGADDVETHTRAFLHHFWTDRACLLVLDDVDSRHVAEAFLPRDGGGRAIITTSQRDLAESLGTGVIGLGPLPLPEALGLLSSLAGAERVSGDPLGSERLCGAASRLPRRIRIAASLLRREAYVSPGDLAARVARDAPALADPREVEAVAVPRASREWSLVGSVESVRPYVSDEAWAFLGALAVFQDAPFTIPWAAEVGRVGDSEATRYLSELGNVHLVSRAAPDGRAGSERWRDPLLRLDHGAIGYARWSAGDRAPIAAGALVQAALAEARLIEALPFEQGIERFDLVPELWRLVFGRLVEATRRGLDQPLMSAAVALRDGDQACAAGPPELFELVLRLRAVFEVGRVPRQAETLMAAFVAAAAAGDRLAQGAVALLLAGDRSSRDDATSWCDASARLLRFGGGRRGQGCSGIGGVR